MVSIILPPNKLFEAPAPRPNNGRPRQKPNRLLELFKTQFESGRILRLYRTLKLKQNIQIPADTMVSSTGKNRAHHLRSQTSFLVYSELKDIRTTKISNQIRLEPRGGNNVVRGDCHWHARLVLLLEMEVP